MKKKLITIILINLLSFNLLFANEKKIEHNIINYPYDAKLIVNLLNKNKDKPKLSKYNLHIYNYIYNVSNNQTLLTEIKKNLKRNKKIGASVGYFLKYMNSNTIKDVEKRFNSKVIKGIDNKEYYAKAFISSVKAFLVRDINAISYFKYKKEALKYSKNKKLFYYIQYKYLYKYSYFSTAYEYLYKIYLEDPYYSIEEELVDTATKGAEKNFLNKKYDIAWILSIEGLKRINDIDFNLNIEKRLKLKKILLASSRELLNKNKIKDKVLYIIHETDKYLKEVSNEKK